MRKIQKWLILLLLMTAISTMAQTGSPATTTVVVGTDSVALQWTASTTAGSVYSVYRSTTNGSGYVPVAIDVTGTTYTDATVQPGTTYYYVVRADLESSNSNQATAVVPASTTPIPPVPPVTANSATFVKLDTTTQGNWMSVYGKDGEALEGIYTNTPTYSTLSVINNQTWTWVAATTDIRALESTPGNRQASAWYNTTSLTLALNLTDGKAHQISIYLVDWDSEGRSEQVTVTDGVTGAILNQQTVKSFVGGQYLVWTITGNVKITASTLSGPNSVISGLFWN